MSIFSETVAATLQGRVVRAAQLVFLDFTSQPMRLAMIEGEVEAGGFTWRGLGRLGSISGLESPLGGSAPVTTLSLSGVEPDQVSKALEASDEVKGRPAVVYLQFFDDAWAPLDSPYALMTGSMDKMSIAADGPTARTISVTVEWLFARRAIPRFGMLSDRDQKARFPGDRGLEQMASMQSKSIAWPTYL